MEKLASLSTSVYVPMEPEWQQIRENVWQEHWQRKRDKICNRCGDCVRYYVASEQVQKRVPEDYGAPPDRYYLIHYSIAKEQIDTNNIVTSDWYQICDKCINHVRGKKVFQLGNNLDSAKAELEIKMAEEMKRRHNQDMRIKLFGKKLKIKKEGEAHLPKLKPEERVRQPEIPRSDPAPYDRRSTGWRGTLHSNDGIEIEGESFEVE